MYWRRQVFGGLYGLEAGRPERNVFHVNDDDPTADQDVALRVRVARLRQEHQDLDAAVHALEHGQKPDQIQIMRLKKKKLILRDEIKQLEDQLTPDIIA